MKRKCMLFLLICCCISIYAQEWTLDSCLSYVLQNNKDLLVTSQNLHIAKWDKKIEQSKLLPLIKLSASADYYWKIPVQSYPGELIGKPSGTTVAIPIGTTWMANYGIDVTWKAIDIATWETIRLESLKQQIAKASTNSFLKLLQRNITMAFYVAQIAKDNKQISQKRYETYTHSHQLIQKLFEQGLIDKISLNQSQSILNNYKDAFSKKIADMENSLTDLKFWMGYDISKPITIKRLDEIYSTDNISFNENNLPDYDEQQTKINIARQQYKVSKSRLLPTLSFVGNYGQNGFADNLNGLKKSSYWYPSGFVGFKVSIPLLSFTDIRISKKQKVIFNQTVLEVAAHQENQQKIFIQGNLKINTAWQSLQIQKEQMKLAEENEYLSLQKIEKGIIDMIQLKQIQQELIEAQEQYSSMKIEYLKICVEQDYLQSNNNR